MRVAEFFAGMGLMRAGLERVGAVTVYANDISPMKAALYRSNWGTDELIVDDICNIVGSDIPPVDLATASFPCTDLSLAGNRAGIKGTDSGLIAEFCRILSEMGAERPPAVIVENVLGFRNINGGQDYRTVVGMLEHLGYNVQLAIIDAVGFLPQSRARVFLLCTRGAQPLIPEPPKLSPMCLADIADHDVEWWPDERRTAVVESLSNIQRARLDTWQNASEIRYFGAYRRTRHRRLVWEIRADEIAGALRTTRGGSSRQALVRAGRQKVEVRWMNLNEYARLQGAEMLSYHAVSERQAMYALGDAVCVPVIEWIGKHWLTRLPL